MKKNNIKIIIVNTLSILLTAGLVCALMLLIKSTTLALVLSAVIVISVCIVNVLLFRKFSSKEVKASTLSVIAHELRSPLTSVKGYLSAITDEAVTADQYDFCVKVASDETDKVIKMLEGVMKLARFDSGRVEIVNTKFDINELLRFVLTNKARSINARGITVRTFFEAEKAFVIADADLIEQVIVNLIDNAVKYNFDNGIISVSTKKINDTISIEIEDTGIGIPQDALEHIWERFYQRESNNSSTYKGHGLGLCIVKEIISAHKQDIKVKSIVGKGTAFTFTLKCTN